MTLVFCEETNEIIGLEALGGRIWFTIDGSSYNLLLKSKYINMDYVHIGEL